MNKLLKIYKLIDRGHPTFLEILRGVKNDIANGLDERRCLRNMYKVFPSYFSLSRGYAMLHVSFIPKGSDSLKEMINIDKHLLSGSYKRVCNIGADDNSFSCTYKHKKNGTVYVYVFMDNTCDIEIEMIKTTVMKPKLTGLCAKVLQDINIIN